MSTNTRANTQMVAEDERIPAGVVLRPIEDVVEQEVEEDVVLYHPGRGRSYVLNETASVVWWLCDGQRNVGQIVAELSGLYKVDVSDVEGDVDEILTQFMLSGLVE